jgi:hypothetical protein
VPEHLDWQIWRIAAADRFSASLNEIEERWSLSDVLDAHEVLDMYEDLEAKARRQR